MTTTTQLRNLSAKVRKIEEQGIERQMDIVLAEMRLLDAIKLDGVQDGIDPEEVDTLVAQHTASMNEQRARLNAMVRRIGTEMGY